MIHHELEQNSPEWIKLRLGKPTASRASDLVSPTGVLSKSIDRYAEELALEMILGRQSGFSGSAATDRGHKLEPMAEAWYTYETNNEISECGFFTDDLGRYGASPDLLSGSRGLVEIKNQEDKGHFKTLLEIKKTGKPPSVYYPQQQMEIMTAEKDWCDLALHHPDLESSIFRIEPCPIFQEKLQSQIALVIVKRDQIIELLQDKAA